MGVIYFNNKSSADINLVVERPPDYEIPERIYQVEPVPGRNGDVVSDTGAFKNVPRSYDIAVGKEGADFASLAPKLSAWLYSGFGYVRLEDDYHPEYFMLARYAESVPLTNIFDAAGRATITFDRKPQRFLKTGDKPVVYSTVNSKVKLNNPTIFVAKPLIKVNGSGAGTVVVNNVTVTINKISTYLMLDSDVEDAYKDLINCNMDVKTEKGYPTLKPGDNEISFTGAITSIEVTPRWWTI